MFNLLLPRKPLRPSTQAAQLSPLGQPIPSIPPPNPPPQPTATGLTQPQTGGLLRQMSAPDTLLRAWRKVKANAGGAGVDGQSLAQFEDKLEANLTALHDELLTNRYQPRQVKRIFVPKSSGHWRALSLLTVRDRVAQRAAHDVLSPLYEPHFYTCSFGFRAGRSTRDAVQAVQSHIQLGKGWVVDGDIKDCFDRIDHDLLLEAVQQRMGDPSVLDLIRRWLQAKVMNDWNPRASKIGVFQGGALSPLLCNIYLHQFDRDLLASHLSLVRYADDWVILCHSQADANAAMTVAQTALQTLKLTINPYRTAIMSAEKGFQFVGAYFVANHLYWLNPTQEKV